VTALVVVLSLAAGLAGGMQVAVMSRFGDRIGIWEAFAFSGLVTAAIGATLLLALRQSWSGYAAAFRAPLWLWLGGVMGALIVITITVAGSRIGTTATVALLICGNLAMAAVIDRYGWFGLERIGLRWERVLGIVLLGVGAALSLRR
jgi:transporter family-2 protein